MRPRHRDKLESTAERFHHSSRRLSFPARRILTTETKRFSINLFFVERSRSALPE